MSLLDLSPPYSVEAEQGVLGGLLLDNNTWDLIADQLVEEDFFKHEHRVLFRAIAILAGKATPFDVVTVHDALPEPAAVGGLAYLGELAKNIPSVANIEHYAEIVRNRSHLRRLMSLGFQCSREAADQQASADEVQESIEQQLFALGQDKSPTESIDLNQRLLKIVGQIDDRFNGNVTLTGLPSGLDDLDEKTTGWQPADLIILAARPSMGKTSLALNFVDSALQKESKKSVQVYSLEMPGDALIYRLLAILGHLDLRNLLTGALEDEDWPKLSAAVSRMNNYGDRLVIDDEAGLTPAALRAKARRFARKYGPPSLIMIDYLQLMNCPGQENRANEISAISRALKALAKEMDCPVIALSQLNRALETRQNKRPVNADLRDSGAIEQDADVIMFVYRDEVYHPQTEFKGIAELIIGKQRQGPTGTVRTAFIPSQTRFANLSASTWQGVSE
ncbi:replicative DNA helicase [Pseudomonas chlororaphis]|uniref:Replicative DNA helicase n=1 Tax=Pseudomonas chlororaphis TaxID=587753 RepID=A0AAX3FTP3_9PSED|nr:replicative DNA helicase [Pseudomonas chlororaphis]AZC39389.1 Replicative DNA helicase (DnaB) [Pseudomonas chlororaphis subsp. piscium]AZC45940.1 Replicative DNA helicase (DnaB) [Pseudomonas chlororaphis subsp. piscium]WDG71474.1 replicative DNA helicase [Pseudomonas chlororaphis]WDH30742.1 replicative DNA helicase [Pseudomonas chlororaphis]WDH70000.1 replicative DNA helicase [Pseudomonas chlororaphis]